MTASEKPLLAITMGDPAGIGPEVIVGAWSADVIHERARLFAVGHPEILRRAAHLLDCDLEIQDIASLDSLADSAGSRRVIPCYNACDDNVLHVPVGQVNPQAGEAAYQAVNIAARFALEGKIDGLVTAPLSKAALHAAGHHYPGHTELLAEMCGVNDFAMMLYLPPRDTAWLGSSASEPQKHDRNHGLGVVHVTLHQSLRSVFANLTGETIIAKCRLVDRVMRQLGVAHPRIAACALNPHAGEEGLFGDEEITIIAPAIEEARRSGLNVSGPYPTDTLMLRARDGEFDAVVAMYHDQGHIALKLLGMHSAVNITLGLPIVRTSVAHGTAFDRAWQGTARSEGMIAAILTAAQLARSKQS